MGQPIDIAPLEPAMLDTAAHTLARAFVDDPMFEWVFPDPGSRTQKLGVLNRIPLEYGLRHGLRVTQCDSGRGVAIWLRERQLGRGRAAEGKVGAKGLQFIVRCCHCDISLG